MNIVTIGYGAMGKILENKVNEDKELNLISVCAKEINSDVLSELNSIDEKIECIIDFSHHTIIDTILSFSVKNNIPVVICTTGYTKEEEEKIKNASKKIPIVYSGNMSIGINVLLEVVSKLTKAIGDNFDIEIIEKHHNLKEDAPSGTAKMLLNAVVDSKEKSTVVNGRVNKSKRVKDEIGVHAIRGGSIVGEHSVIFAGQDEVIEIKHTAMSKAIFVVGAIKAAKKIISFDSGLYDMNSILFK